MPLLLGDAPNDTPLTPVDHQHPEYQTATEKGQAGGYAALDAGTKVPIGQLPTGATGATVAVGNHLHAEYQPVSQKGQANGYAGLDAAGKVPAAQLPTGTGSAAAYADLPAGTTALAFATNTTVKTTVGANITLTTTVPPAGQARHLIVVTSGTVTRTITFGAGFKPTGTLATGTVAARVFVLAWVSDGVNLYEVSRTAAMPA